MCNTAPSFQLLPLSVVLSLTNYPGKISKRHHSEVCQRRWGPQHRPPFQTCFWPDPSIKHTKYTPLTLHRAHIKHHTHTHTKPYHKYTTHEHTNTTHTHTPPHVSHTETIFTHTHTHTPAELRCISHPLIEKMHFDKSSVILEVICILFILTVSSDTWKPAIEMHVKHSSSWSQVLWVQDAQWACCIGVQAWRPGFSHHSVSFFQWGFGSLLLHYHPVWGMASPLHITGLRL